MTARIAPGAPMSRLHVERETLAREVHALLDEIEATLQAPAAAIFRVVLNTVVFGLGKNYACLVDTLTGDFGWGPVVPGMHHWLRRVVAHTLLVCDGASRSDRDTAVLTAFFRELGVCTETQPLSLTVFDLIDHGAMPGMAHAMRRVVDYLDRREEVGPHAAELERVMAAIRQLDVHPWCEITMPAASLARAGRASAAALAVVSAATSELRKLKRAELAGVDAAGLALAGFKELPPREPDDMPF